jgi:hypothetical protein
MRHADPKTSLPIFSMAASLHNSSALSQAIASVHYSAGEVAGAYYALHAAALQEGEKITRMQFWQMYFPRAQPGLLVVPLIDTSSRYGSTCLIMGYFDDAISALRRGLSIGGDLDATASMTRELSVALVITRQFEAAARQLLLFLSRQPMAFPALIADAVTFAASVPAAASSLPLSHNTSKLLVDFGQLFINLEEVEVRAMKAGASEAKKHKITLTNDAPRMWAVIADAKGPLFAAKAASAAANLLHIAASSTSSLSPSTRSQTWNILGHFLHEVGGDRMDAVMALGTASRSRDEAVAGAMSEPHLAELARAAADAEASSSSSVGKEGALSGMRIFVYSLPPVWNTVLQGLNTDQCRYSIYGAEIFIHEQLIMSPYVTRNASQATHFFVPFYSSCMMSSRFVKPGPGRPNNDVDIGNVAPVFALCWCSRGGQVLSCVK